MKITPLKPILIALALNMITVSAQAAETETKPLTNALSKPMHDALPIKALSSAKDASSVETVKQKKLLSIIKDKSQNDQFAIIDVRSPEEFHSGYIPTATNIPYSDILNNISLLDPYKDKQIILYCRSGARVKKVTELTSFLNYKNIGHLQGDMLAWKANHLPIEIK